MVKPPAMDIRRVLALRGPNIWSRQPALEVWVDLGPLKDTSSEQIPGFNDRLMSWLPSLIEHRCSVGERGGFFQRLRRGTYLAHILEHVTLELQTLAGTPVGFGRARETHVEGVYKVAIRYQEESLGRACLETARRLCLAAVYDLPFEIAAELKPLRELADRVCLGPSTQAIVDAARARNIPVRRLNAGSLVQLGHGVYQRRIWTAETDRTSAIAESIAQDKDLTKAMLQSAGIPVPEGRQVEDAADAWAAAEELGGPVVVKPLDANHGRGVFMNLTGREQVVSAYHEALKEGSGVLVENFAPGSEHRLLVVGGKLVAAARGDAVIVIGDGQQTIAELIETQINSDPRRGDDEQCPLNPVLLDAMTLTELDRQGMGPATIPRQGARVLVRRNDNLSNDVTDDVHPSVAEHAVLAAQVVGLDIAGLDVVATNISRPLEEQGGVIVEVNAGPGLLMHLRPSEGKPRPVGEAIVGMMFPNEESGRVPIVCITGTNGKTTVSRLLANILKHAGRTVGLACSDGITVNGRVIETGDCAGPRSARNVLLNPLVDTAVLEAGRGGILREGLGFDKCDVAVVTNIGRGDHLGGYDIQTAEDMFKVKRTPVDVILPTGSAVLNAADPVVAEMAPLSAGGVVFFALDPDHPVLARHRSEGRRAVAVRNGVVTLYDGPEVRSLATVSDLPCTHGGRAGFQVENVLAAAAAAWSLGLHLDVIRDGLKSFNGNLTDDPARFNVLEVGGRTLVVTETRNLSALEALVQTLDQFPQTSRSIVFSAEEDRRDCDIELQGHLLGSAFDRVYLCELDAGRARQSGDVIAAFQRGLQGAPRTRHIEEILDWNAAVDAAWDGLQRGELLVVQSSHVAQTVRKIRLLAGLERLVPEAATAGNAGTTIAFKAH